MIAFNTSVGKSERSISLGIPRLRYKDAGWIKLAQDRI